VSDSTDLVYIGSTTQSKLSSRMVGHRADYRKWLANEGVFISSFRMLEKGDARIVLVENYPCNSKDELNAREQHNIDMQGELCVNQLKDYTGLTKQEYKAQWRQENLERLFELGLQYRETNKETIRANKAAYRKKNIQKIHKTDAEKYLLKRDE